MSFVNKYLRNFTPYKVASHKIWTVGPEQRKEILKLDWNEAEIQPSPKVGERLRALVEDGTFMIIRDKSTVDIKQLQHECHKWLIVNYYCRSQEWQYKNIRPCIIKQLLLDRNSHIPNDYKLHFINGQLQFVYCSTDREGANYRSIYSPEWKRLDMEWVEKKNRKGGLTGEDIPQPQMFEKMKEIGTDIAKWFCYARVGFYEVDGKRYYGEITLHYGSGFDTFEPAYWDQYFGDKLTLSRGGYWLTAIIIWLYVPETSRARQASTYSRNTTSV